MKAWISYWWYVILLGVAAVFMIWFAVNANIERAEESKAKCSAESGILIPTSHGPRCIVGDNVRLVDLNK